MHPSKVGSLLASDPGLQPVVAKAREISALLKLCFDFLPPGLARLVRTVNLRDSQLVLLAASPAAAAKLKLLSDSLRKYLLEQGAKVNAVSVRVQPAARELPQAPARRPPRLSPAGLSALQELYRKLPDSPARRALKTLLDHQFKREPAGAGRGPPPGPPRRDRS